MRGVTHSIADTGISILGDLLDLESLIQGLRVLKTKLADRRLRKGNTEEEILIQSSDIFALKRTVLDSHRRCLSSKNALSEKGDRGGQFHERRHGERKAWRDTSEVSEPSC
jgi:hypothetical protein